MGGGGAKWQDLRDDLGAIAGELVIVMVEDIVVVVRMGCRDSRQIG